MYPSPTPGFAAERGVNIDGAGHAEVAIPAVFLGPQFLWHDIETLLLDRKRQRREIDWVKWQRIMHSNHFWFRASSMEEAVSSGTAYAISNGSLCDSWWDVDRLRVNFVGLRLLQLQSFQKLTLPRVKQPEFSLFVPDPCLWVLSMQCAVGGCFHFRCWNTSWTLHVGQSYHVDSSPWKHQKSRLIVGFSQVVIILCQDQVTAVTWPSIMLEAIAVSWQIPRIKWFVRHWLYFRMRCQRWCF